MFNKLKRTPIKKILFTLLIISLSSQSVHGAIFYGSNNAINVIDESEIITFTDINETLYPSYGNNFIEYLGDNIWLVKKPIYIGNATVLIDGNIDACEVRFLSTIPHYGGKGEIMTDYPSVSNPRVGEIIIKNSTINTWNLSINKPEYKYENMVRIYMSDGIINNVTFEAVDEVKLYHNFSSDVSDVMIKNSFEGLNLEYLEGIKLSNITAKNISFTGISLGSCSNIEVSDYYFCNHEMYQTPYLTAANGITLGYGKSNYVHDATIIGPRWGGVYIAGSESNSIFENISVSYAGHNGIDIHGGTNLTYLNIVSSNSASNNYLLSGTTTPVSNITIENFVSVDPAARGLVGGWAVDDVHLKNFTSIGSASTSIQFFNASNISIMDFKSSDPDIDAALQLTYAEGYGTNNIVLIDSVLTESSYKDIWFTGLNTNNIIINSKFDNFRSATGVDYSTGYYLDLITMYQNGTMISNSNLEIKSSLSDVVSLDAFGSEETVFSLDSNGHVKLPNNDRTDSPILINYYKSQSGQELFPSYNLDVLSPNNYKISDLDEITPDSSWYREDPNVPTYTITAIIPDDSTSGPHVTGFAPSEDNPFNAGETKKFRVWTDEDLTNMKWYVDSDLVSSGSMEYEWDIEMGSHTIMFTGSNTNGAVLQTWEITEGSETPDEETPVSSGTGLSFTPSATSLETTVGDSTTFSVDSDQIFTGSVWYFDDVQVASGSTGYTQSWDTGGTHTVKFEGTAAAGSISRTWTAVVSEPEASGSSSISISPSSSTVAPGEAFSLDVYIDPAQSLTGSQFNLQYSTLASATSVQDGGLFSLDGLSSTFRSGQIDNTASVIREVYSAIVGSGTVSTAGSMATVNMVAGSTSGLLELTLSNVVLSDVNSNPAPYDVSYATVLVDTAPEFNVIPDVSADEEDTISFTVSATDSEGDNLTYSATSLPAGASFDTATATFIWTPSEGDAGSYEAVFEVTDGYLNDSVSVPITVAPLNHAPVISLFEPADASVFEEGSAVNVSVAATDEDGDSLSYTIKIDDVQVTTSSNYTWDVDYESAGTHTIEVTVSDGIDEVSSMHTITITDLQPRWDVNEDGVINVLDITLVGQNYGTTYTGDLPRWDVNQDGTVNIQDLSIVAGHFGETV